MIKKKNELGYEDYSEIRKQGQADGTYPTWMSTAGAQLFIKKYLYEAENPREQFTRIADTLAQFAPILISPQDRDNVKMSDYNDFKKYWASKFFDNLWSGYNAGSTPLLANTGTDRGLPISCSGGIPVEDSVSGFYDAAKEIALLTKYGFGTAVDVSNIRHRGSSFRGDGKAGGALPVIEMLSQVTSDISQGSARRGAIASYIDIEHKDFYEIAEFMQHNPDKLNIGWIVNDKFIQKLDNGNKDSHKRFKKALYVKSLTGKGYFAFMDKAERLKPDSYKLNDIKVSPPQLCVAPETPILTDTGYQVISTLRDQEVNVWNGEQFSKTIVRRTGVQQELLKVVTDSGQVLECTPYHKFYVRVGAQRDGKIYEKRANELKSGDKLIKLVTPVIEGAHNLPHAYENGFYSGDGCNVKGERSRIYLYGEKRKLLHLFDKTKIKVHTIQDKQNREYFYFDDLKEKFFVPDVSYNIQSRLSWFAGLLDSDGTVARTSGSQCLQIASVEQGFLENIQLMLQTLGVQSKVRCARVAGTYLLPANDGTGKLKEFDCKHTNRLLISGMGIVKLRELGLVTNRLKISDHIPNRNAETFVKVKEVVHTGRIDDTYCFTEPLKNLGVFNGILTGNCNEIFLHSDDITTYICCLSWMNLSLYDEWKDSDAIYVATIMLDCVISYFISIAKDIKGLEKAVRGAVTGRPLGLGAGGLSTLFQKRMIPFDSIDAFLLNREIFAKIEKESDQASRDLAAIYGESEWSKGTGKRHSHIRAVAPTKSTALIYGGIGEGISPDVAFSFTQSTAGGEIARVTPVLLELIKSKGLNVEKCIDEIDKNKGSVQNVDWLTPHEKSVFKTGFEVQQEAILRMASDRQQYIDQGQSLNLFIDSRHDESYISYIHQLAFRDKYIKGLYYLTGKREDTTSNDVVAPLECESCQ